MIHGVITFIDIEKAYAVALSDDQKHEAIIHKEAFDRCNQPFRASSTPQAVEFTTESRLGYDERTGVTKWIASEVKLASA